MQAIRRGTWVAVQLQLVFILVMALLAIQARLYLSGLPDSILVRTSVTAVPCIVYLAILVVLDKQLWRVPAKRAPAVGDASASQEPEEATAPAEVDSRQREPAVEDDSGAERPSEQLVRAVPRDLCTASWSSTSCTMPCWMSSGDIAGLPRITRGRSVLWNQAWGNTDGHCWVDVPV